MTLNVQADGVTVALQQRQPRGNHAIGDLSASAQQGYDDASGATTSERAFAAIEAMRASAVPPIANVRGTNGGTAALVVGPDGRVYAGANSHALNESDGGALPRSWADYLGYSTTPADRLDRTAMFHAESIALMNMHAQITADPVTGLPGAPGARLGEEYSTVTIYVDRLPCQACQKELGGLAQAMGIESLTIETASGNIFSLQDGRLALEP